MGGPSQDREKWVGLLLVCATVAALILPQGLTLRLTTPDAVEHIAIANALVHGAGFVDPIQSYYFLEATSPLPAFTVRAPVVPLLVSIPLGLGLDLQSIYNLHALWAVLLACVSYWLLLAIMPVWAAASAVVLTSASPIWLQVTLAPFTEPTAAVLIVGIVACAVRIPGSLRAAILCAALVIIGWMTRPNLGVMWVAVTAGLVWSMGVRAALRCRPLYAFALCFVVLFVIVHSVHVAFTGLAPYAGYGVAAQHLDAREWLRYGVYDQSSFEFVVENAPAVAAIALQRVGQVTRTALFDFGHLFLGWWMLVGWWFAARTWRRIPPAQAILVLAGLGFLAVQLLRYASFEPRYSLQMIQCGVLSAFLVLGDWLPGGFDRATKRTFEPRVVLAALVCTALALAAPRVPLALHAARTAGGQKPEPGYCADMEPDALVATSIPWSVHMDCGHATIKFPRNAGRPLARAVFLSARRPSYILAEQRLAERLSDLPEIGRYGDYVLLRATREWVKPQAVWRAPPAPTCAGREGCGHARAGGESTGSSPPAAGS